MQPTKHCTLLTPAGLSFHIGDSSQELATVEKILFIPSSTTLIGLRADGQAVHSPHGPEFLPLVGNHYRLFAKYGHIIKITNMGRTTYSTDKPEATAVALAESAHTRKKVNEHHLLSLNKKTPLVPSRIDICHLEILRG